MDVLVTCLLENTRECTAWHLYRPDGERKAKVTVVGAAKSRTMSHDQPRLGSLPDLLVGAQVVRFSSLTCLQHSSCSFYRQQLILPCSMASSYACTSVQLFVKVLMISKERRNEAWPNDLLEILLPYEMINQSPPRCRGNFHSVRLVPRALFTPRTTSLSTTAL